MTQKVEPVKQVMDRVNNMDNKDFLNIVYDDDLGYAISVGYIPEKNGEKPRFLKEWKLIRCDNNQRTVLESGVFDNPIAVIALENYKKDIVRIVNEYTDYTLVNVEDNNKTDTNEAYDAVDNLSLGDFVPVFIEWKKQ